MPTPSRPGVNGRKSNTLTRTPISREEVRLRIPSTISRRNRVGITDDSALFSDDELTVLIDDFVHAASLAEQAGFRFVDIKHCHGYLGHELLSGFDRPGKYGGSFENRTRFLREIVEGIRGNSG